jgi:UPF0271 protein
MRIDLNCDLGELPEGNDEMLMPLITSANIACGGHAGDRSSMERTLNLTRKYGVAAGAHPSYPDRENFGRLPLPLSFDEVTSTVQAQVSALLHEAVGQGVRITHVKPHGALYNVAARDAAVARAIAAGVRLCAPGAVLVGLAGSAVLEVWQDCGFRTAAEAFADRAYEPDGSLRPRHLAAAVIQDPAEAAEHALELVNRLAPRTLCVHGDNPAAAAILAAVRTALERAGHVVSGLADDGNPVGRME